MSAPSDSDIDIAGDVSENSDASAESPASSVSLNSMPLEILEQILFHVCQGNDRVELPPGSYTTYYSFLPLTISWVCSRWKAIALANPAFWAPPYILICLGRYNNGPAYHDDHALFIARGIAVLERYFERSHPLPFPKVDIYGLDSYESWEDTIGEIVRCIVSSAHRWQSCSIPYQLAHWLSITPAAAPDPVLLEAVTLKDNDDTCDRLDFFCRAPRLRRWTSHVKCRSLNILTIPWRQLTEISITSFMSVRYFMLFIRHCEQLVDLLVCLRRSTFPTAPLPSFDSVTLPNLNSATFALNNEDILSSLFSTLITPRLTFLSLVYLSPAEEALRNADPSREVPEGHLCLQRWPSIAFYRWLARSQCTLQGLVLAQIMMPRDQLVWILEQLPHLQHLSIQEFVERQPPCPVLGHQHASSIDDNVLRRLTAPLGCNPTLLPELRGLTVAGVLEFGGDVLLDMVKSRVDLNLESPSHLEFLCVYPEIGSTTELDDSTEMQLEDLLGDKFILPENAIIIRSQRRAMDFKERPQALTFQYQPEFME